MKLRDADFPERTLIAFVTRAERISEGPYGRTSYEFDSLDASVRADDLEKVIKDTRACKPFALVRVVTTERCFETNFDFVPKEGAWVEITIRPRGNDAGPIAFLSELEEEGYVSHIRGTLDNARFLFPAGEIPPEPRPIGASVPEASKLATKLANRCLFPQTAVASPDVIGKFLWKLKAANRVKVRDVGQASFVTLMTKRDREIAHFDAGWPISFNLRTAPKALPVISNKAPVILSHWDWDHLHGYYKFPQLKLVNWITPVQPLGPGACRIATQLHGKGLLNGFDGVPLIFLSGVIDQCGSPSATSVNDSGLALSLCLASGERTLFVGDSSYSCLGKFSSHWDPDLLVVTHHGARINSAPPKPRKTSGIGIVSVGKGNVYQHPNQQALQAHTALSWSLIQTCADNANARGDRIFP